MMNTKSGYLGQCGWCGAKSAFVTLPPRSQCLDIKQCDLNRLKNVEERKKKNLPFGPHLVTVRTKGLTYFLLKITYSTGFYYELILEEDKATVFAAETAMILARDFHGKILPVVEKKNG